MRIRLAIPDELDDQDRQEALDAALESVTRCVAAMVKKGISPPAAGEIKSKRVVWQPEPPGDEHFDLPTTIMGRGWGDCDDLAPWHAGSLRAGGVDPGARAFVKRSGPTRWHALVKRSDGSIEDPSKAAGMGHSVSGEGDGVGPAITAPMSKEGKLCLAICPTQDRSSPLVWFARCDVPDSLEPWDWSTSAAHTDPSKALLHAVKTAQQVVGEDMDEEDYLRLGAVNDLILGADPEAVAEALAQYVDDDVVGEILGDAVHSVGFFGGLLKGVKSVVKAPFKIAKQAVSTAQKVVKLPFKIPGVSQLVKAGTPLAASFFGGPAAGMIANQLTPYLIPSGPNLPGYAGQAMNMLPMLSQLASGGMNPQAILSQLSQGGGGVNPQALLSQLSQGGGGVNPQALLSQLSQGGGGGFPDLSRLLQNVPGATQALERGVPARPWGVSGPTVMRF
jgi:hypothetical protein